VGKKFGDQSRVIYPLWDMPGGNVCYPKENVAGAWAQHTMVMQAQATHKINWRK